jgi:hypothetical protein
MQNPSPDPGRDARVVPLHADVRSAPGVVNMPWIPAGRPLATPRPGQRTCRARLGRAVSLVPRNGGGPVMHAAHHPTTLRLDRRSDLGQCGLFAVDIARFTAPHRDDDIQVYMHESLYKMLETAFDRSDVSWADCSHEDRGDGVLIVAPAVIPAAMLAPIADRLRTLIRRHNRVSCEAAHIQLRTAVHLGPVHHDGHGFIGADVNLLCRLLDVRQLKYRLANSATEIALITSDYFYSNVIRRQPSFVDPALFDSVRIRVKETRARAWVYLPGA